MTYLDINELRKLNLITIEAAIINDIDFYSENAEIDVDDIGFDEIIIDDKHINLSFYIWNHYKKTMVHFENEVYSIEESDQTFIRDLLIDIEELEKTHPDRVIRE